MNKDHEEIIEYAIKNSMPEKSIAKALNDIDFEGKKIILVSIGKAAFNMAKASYQILGRRIKSGIVITKYGHSKGSIGDFKIYEAGHPYLDENSIKATDQAIDMVSNLDESYIVLFLVSGGGSSLFEKPMIGLKELRYLSEELLNSGASIGEINTIRKRLSHVKAGRFALLCRPAHVYSLILSDVVGDSLDVIASGPSYLDTSSSTDALRILDKYEIKVSNQVLELLKKPTIKNIDNVTNIIIGNVEGLCQAAGKKAELLGYKSQILTCSMTCNARDAGSFIGSIGEFHKDSRENLAFIFGGETTVKVKGKGKGGRNQELLVSALGKISSIENVSISSIDSDGIDGITDVAGGYVDGNSKKRLVDKNIDIDYYLSNNDSYYLLKECDGHIKIGETSTNVNDLTILLIKKCIS